MIERRYETLAQFQSCLRQVKRPFIHWNKISYINNMPGQYCLGFQCSGQKDSIFAEAVFETLQGKVTIPLNLYSSEIVKRLTEAIRSDDGIDVLYCIQAMVLNKERMRMMHSRPSATRAQHELREYLSNVTKVMLNL